MFIEIFAMIYVLHFIQLNINSSCLVDIYSRQDLQSVHLSLRSPSERLSIRLNNDLDINLKLTINFILYVIVLPLPSFLIGTEKEIYYSVFYPKNSNCRSNSSASSFIIK